MQTMSTVSQTSIRLRGKAISGAEDRQQKIPGFDQARYSQSKVVCIGAGGIIGHIAPTVVRKGIGAITVFDDDFVDASNLNRQRFYERDIGRNKAIALATNLHAECICTTEIRGYAMRFEEAVARGIDLSCDAAFCGVDNNPARSAASLYFRQRRIPVIFCAVSADADHGYVFLTGARRSLSGVFVS
jgi:molybdopterin/thiamine biosynthesis adenylyltransferase